MTRPQEQIILSYAPHPKLPPWTNWLLKPFGWPTYFASILGFLLWTWSASYPYGELTSGLLGGFIWTLLAIHWIFRAGIRLVLIQILKDPSLRWWHGARSGLVPIFVFLLALLTMITMWPLRLRFAASESAMDRLAKTVMTTAGPYRDQNVGWFFAHEIRRVDGGVQFFVCVGGGLGSSGFAYCSSGLPMTRTVSRCSHFSGDWYLVGGE